MYQCNLCDKVLCNSDRLNYHLLNKVCQKPSRICPQCGKVFESKRNCQYHISRKVCSKRKTQLIIKQQLIIKPQLILKSHVEYEKTQELIPSSNDHILNDIPTTHVTNNTNSLDGNSTRVLIQKISKEQRDILSKLSQCSTKASCTQKKETILAYITSNNQLDEYIKSGDFNVNSMYLLMLLEDTEIDLLYKKVMNIESNDSIGSKILTILKNHSQWDIPLNRKKHISKSIKKIIWEKYCGINSKCYCCGNQNISPFDFEAGHIIPESKGGQTTAENLRPICSLCNRSMNNTDMKEFTKKFFPDSPLLKE